MRFAVLLHIHRYKNNFILVTIHNMYLGYMHIQNTIMNT